MPTDVIKTIGATSSPTTPDFTSLQAWEDAAPADLVASDQRWIGECLDQGEFTSASTLLTISGQTTDATRYVILRCATGASFKDKAGVRATALYYSASNGVALRVTGAYAYGVKVQAGYTQISGLQIKHDSTSYFCLLCDNGGGGQNATVSQCLFQTGGWDCIQISTGSVVKNCLVVVTGGSGHAGIWAVGSANVYGTTVVRTGSAGGSALKSEYGTLVAKNSAVFNFSTAFEVGGGGAYTGSSYCATDAASLTGSNHQTSLTYASQFVSSSNDFRAVSSGGLKAGTPDSTNTPADITGLTRDATTPYIGCWEVAAAASAFNPYYYRHLAGGG